MFNVADYLKKFAAIQNVALVRQDAITASFQEVCGFKKVPVFETRKGILYLKASPVEKMMVFTRKAALLAAIKTKDPMSAVFDIR